MQGAGEVPVALVLVSHSQDLARGLAELAGQMAPLVHIAVAGGMDDGGLGTSFEKVSDAIEAALQAAGSAVILADLGSAKLTVESVLDFDDDVAARVRLVDAPFVEGAVAAAVTANGGGGLQDVAATAVQAARMFAGAGGDGADAGQGEGEEGGGEAAGGVCVLTLRNKLGLHARPAAVLARAIAGFDAEVTINGANGASVLELMRLGAVGGDEIRVVASGAQASQALAAVTAMVEEGFGEE